MGQIDNVMYLTATTFYAISSILYIYCLVFKKEDRIKYALTGAVAGLLFHSVSIALRWIETGHGPYINMYEVLSKYAWFSVAIFLIIQQKYEKIKIAGFIVMPVTFLIMGVGLTYSRDIEMIPASLRSYWLIAHVVFANLAFGSILVAVGVAALYILKVRHSMALEKKDDSFYERLPELKVMDELMYQFVAAGLLFLTIMIGSGAIWANQTWGRYWGWDPIETWSLISWFMYAISLHLRVNVGWSGKRFAWFIIFSIFVLAFSLLGVGAVYSGLHTDYITS
ncbi:MAG TPA: c-type cytochrome biogenesis protein CcsB [candidate division Zixibacteria bacterium]|nr:c-type cytochrome biogenesis protein CcsB [candidate division Zixibacteria bacterium]